MDSVFQPRDAILSIWRAVRPALLPWSESAAGTSRRDDAFDAVPGDERTVQIRAFEQL